MARTLVNTRKNEVILRYAKKDKSPHGLPRQHLNIRNMERKMGHKAGKKMKLLLEYDNQHSSISDPWYSNRFDETYKDVVTGCTAFLKYLENEGKI